MLSHPWRPWSLLYSLHVSFRNNEKCECVEFRCKAEQKFRLINRENVRKKISRLSLYYILFSGGIFSRCPVRLKTFLESNDGRNYPSQFHLSAISEPTLNSDFYGATRFLLRNNPCTNLLISLFWNSRSEITAMRSLLKDNEPQVRSAE